ncbi:restriction endonuclease subunit S [Flavobacterium orientale]|uniref:Type I restriction modification DNA specificity domain-containing protein n=1 Tax=Flavobacterium orientale TaxID=1756020 RepID=A0A917DCD8_9FLAO|nr:restriction endonuclease subunit S [Flavobacterium orientale]GGD26326.1 hypothetical protein GCM10011343_15690 [Flavobacterium orientale]
MKEGWEYKKLGDLTEVITKGTTPTSVGFNFEDEGVNFVKIESITSNGNFIVNKFAHISSKANEALKRSQLKEGDILFSIAGALGRTAIVSKDILPANTNQALSIIRLKVDENVLIEYIFLALTSGYALEQIEKFKGGVAQQNLSLEQMKSFQIPIPPLQEQKQIVAILDQAFEAIDQAKTNIEKNIANAKELFQSKLNDIFSQKGDGREEKKLEEISNIINGYSFKSNDFSDDNEIKSIKITNVGIMEFVEDISNNLPSSFANDYSKVKVHEGDLVLALTRTIISGGLKVARVPKSYHHALLNQRVAAIVPNVEKVDSDYLYYYFSSNIVYNYVLDNVNTLMQPNLSIEDLKRMIVPITSIKGQKTISTQIKNLSENTNSLINNYGIKLKDLEDLKKSILQKAFAGELTNKEVEV